MLHNVLVRNTCVQQKPPDLSVGSVTRLRIGFSLTLLLCLITFAGMAQEDSEGITLNFTFHNDNPVIAQGADGEWDGGTIQIGCVIHEDGVFHMMYDGAEAVEGPWAIGYASSTDGLTWTKYPGNPVVTVDLEIYSNGINGGPCYVEDGQWIMYAHPTEVHAYMP